MDKKKIAVFSTGWSGEILHQYMLGVRDGLKNISADLYLFLSHAVNGGPGESYFKGEVNIYNLPNMEDFDAALIFANGLDFPDLLENLNERCNKAGIPVIYTGKDDSRFYYVGSDNYIGTRAMAKHMIEEHEVRNVWYIAGSQDNMDSNHRMQAIMDELSENGLQLKEEDICYTNWSPYVAYSFVLDRVKKGIPLPDAIMCANDTMAMVICSELRKNGYAVPRDVLVTGFDNEPLAQTYDPSISSVDQRFDNIGRTVADTLVSLLEGKSVPRSTQVSCEFIPSESCGCTSAKDFSSIRRQIGRDRFDERVATSNFDMRLSTIERIILGGREYSDFGACLMHLNKVSIEYEGHTFYVAMDPAFEKSIMDPQYLLRSEGYPEYMDVVFSKDADYISSQNNFETRKLIPLLNPQGENRFFLFLPLHENQYTYGYIVFGDDLEKLRDVQKLRKYVERFNIIVGKFYQNLRLDALNQRLLQMTETDALTHVKNRNAFENRQGDLQARMQKEVKPEFALAVFDINNLKNVNDSLGHEAGDDYIINCCRMICKTFKKSAVYRIGGDEFVVVMENDDYVYREELLQDMRDEMELMKDKELPIFEQISIASGLAVYNPAVDFNISDVFSRADAAMYDNKTEMKGL